MKEVLRFYASPGPLSDVSAHTAWARALPDDLPSLCLAVQGLLVHPHLASLYGLDPAKLHLEDLEIRAADAMLDRVLLRDPSALDRRRPPERRFVGNCRHHALLLASILRARGVPARPRCGFGAYFERGRFVDHWLCEVWDVRRNAWRQVDAQIDALQRERFKLAFDPIDVPPGEFLVAGEAWQRCRAGLAAASSFGILDMWGLWFVRGNLVRDVAALAKRELLPWDGWGMMSGPGVPETAEDLTELDRVAALTLSGDAAHESRLALYDTNPAFRVPRKVFSFAIGAEVELGDAVAAPARHG